MDWQCNRNFLLLLTVGVLVRSAIQGTEIDPKKGNTVEVCVGSSVTINCSFSPVNTPKVKWCFKQQDFMNDCKKVITNLDDSSVHHFQQENGKAWSNLTIKEVKYNESGYYFCEVTQDIPILQVKNTSATYLKILSENSDDNSTSTTYSPATCDINTSIDTSPVSESPGWWLWVSLVVGVFVLVTALSITWVICFRKPENPIYENTTSATKKLRKLDRSPRLDKGKTMKETDSRQPHNYEYRPTGKRLSP